LKASKRRGWTLLVIPEDESHIRQFRLPRKAVMIVIGVAALVVVYALVETVLFWTVARRAAQVEPLRRRINQLENSSEDLARLGGELTRLKEFEQQIRRVMGGSQGGTGQGIPPARIGFEYLPTELDAGSPGKSLTSPVAEARGVGGAAYTAMDVPTSPPVRGYITRRFVRPVSEREVSHRGVDIAAAEGTPVMTAADGLVLFAEWTYQYGNLVVIAHRSGFTTFYGHNQVLFVHAGDRVRQGEPIALVGSSGISTAPHLHFEVWQDESPVDPLTLLERMP